MLVKINIYNNRIFSFSIIYKHDEGHQNVDSRRSHHNNRLNSSIIQEILQKTKKVAINFKHTSITTEHLFLVLLDDEDVIELLEDLGVNHSEIMNVLLMYLVSLEQTKAKHTELEISLELQKCIQYVIAMSMITEKKKIDSIDILQALTKMDNSKSVSSLILKDFGITNLKIAEYLAKKAEEFDNKRNMFGNNNDVIIIDNDIEFVTTGNFFDFSGNDTNQLIFNITPPNKNQIKAARFLRNYAKNISEMVANSKETFLVGREKEIEQICVILSRKNKNNVILIGEPGVGKTAIVEGLAKKILLNQVPEGLRNKTIWSLDLNSMVAGTKIRGDFEERAKDFFNAIQNDSSIILFIDEIHQVVGAGQSYGSLDFSNLLKPVLSRGGIKCIGATTHEEYHRFIEKDKALSRRFYNLIISEPTPEQTKEIIKGVLPDYESFHGIKYSEEAINLAIDIGSKYIHNKQNPDRTIDIIDQIGARMKLKKNSLPNNIITEDHIIEEISRMYNIPRYLMEMSDKERLRKLEEKLKENVYGQDHALEELVYSVIISVCGMRDAKKPKGVYMFAGPTGTGKTETAKTLASVLGIPLIKFDMSEYAEKHTISKLIGAPPGYIGYENEGKLISSIEKNPASVLLFDEIEKADKEIYNVMLQIMDEGVLTSSKGKTVKFNNCYIIFTTNAGSWDNEKNGMGFIPIEKDAEDKAIKETFSPEFRSRLDAIVKFKPISKDTVFRIIDKQIKMLNEMLKSNISDNISITISESAKEWIYKHGFDSKRGARHLDTIIKDYIKKPLSKKMIFDDFSGHIMVDYDLVKNTIVLLESSNKNEANMSQSNEYLCEKKA